MKRLDWRALGLAILIEGALCGFAMFGGPHGNLGAIPWMLQLPGILFVFLVGSQEWFFVRVGVMIVFQTALWYGIIAFMRRRRAAAVLPLLLCGVVTGCVRSPDLPAAAERPVRALRAFPRIGIAVTEEAGGWCAEFQGDSMMATIAAGSDAAIVLPQREGPTHLPAMVGASRTGECPAAFAQGRWVDYRAYEMTLTGSPDDSLRPPVALIVLGDAPWSRGPDGRPRADLDGDGVMEEFRACVAEEGEHFTIWSVPDSGAAIRRWHEYYDWGGITDPTCGPGENGLD